MSMTVRLNKDSSLRGRTTYVKGGVRPVYAFLGVPYAAPPVGERRFQPPQPAIPWKGERDATKFGAICPQVLTSSHRSEYPFPVDQPMSEDCLYLNVWSPDVKPRVKLPVMVWIHGGSFLTGFGDFYDGTALCANHNVVVVSINYRLGPLGFMCIEEAGIKGNMGLLDQVEAMRWIKKNIAAFGGDPENVTLFGESAGSISISAHIVSPLSKGLFRRAICESGVAVYPGTVWTPKNAAKYYIQQLKRLGCKSDSTKDVVDFLRSAPTDVFTREPGFPTADMVLDDFFMPDKPENLYKANKINPIDLLLGFNTSEGFHFVSPMFDGKCSANEARKLIEKIVKRSFYRGNPNGDRIVKILEKAYVDSCPDQDGVALMESMSDLYGDNLFVAPIVKLANLHSASQRTYLYRFEHRPSFINRPDWVTADHTDEIGFVIGEPFMGRFPVAWTSSEKLLSHNMMTYWTNFAKFGIPNEFGLPQWPLYDGTTQKFMVLDEDITVADKHEPETMRLWNEEIASLCEPTQAKL